MIMTLFSEPENRRRLALATRGLSVRSALGLARLLPEDIIIREKQNDVFDSILYEAETGEMPDDWWDYGPASFKAAARQFARRELLLSGNNRSETARRLGVSRATIIRHTDPTPR